jgi:23S rRNA (cytosine1962-C5)-methyltransferase
VNDLLTAAGRVRLTGRGRKRWLRGHPWIYADDLSEVEAERGALVAVEDPHGTVVAYGAYSADSRLALRLIVRAGDAPADGDWRAHARTLLARAVAAREAAGLADPAGAARVLFGDSEGWPGLIIDRYADVLVVQCGTQFADRTRDLALELCAELLPRASRAVVDRSDASVRRLEGLEARVEVVRGALPDELVVREQGLAYEVDVLGGHKTGHYLDQRANRVRFAARCAGLRVLDAFSYDGLFGLRAALAGASEVVCVDQSAEALARLARNAERNGLAQKVRGVRADAMKDLRERHAAGERFGAIALDPPPFARSRAEVAGAERGYREVNSRALRLLEPGGFLATASCSYAIDAAQFLEILAQAARDAGRPAWLEQLCAADVDHPVLLGLPESGYLKCAFVRSA